VNFSLSTSCFSKHWKKSVLSPIPKKSEVRELDDLRPISILPSILKVVERVVHNQLAHFLCVHGLLDEFQSRFRRSHSTTTALLKVLNDLPESFIRSMVSLLFFLISTRLLIKSITADFSKYSELSVCVISWLASYLHDRAQSVIVVGK
jgi:hypothetical protein